MNKKALVTGGAGFIGHHLVKQLLAQGTRVTVLDDLSSGCRENLPIHAALRFIEGSVLSASQVADAAKRVDIVFHLASVVGMRLAVRQRDQAYHTAVEGTRTVLAATGGTPTVLFSSSAVYGLTVGELAREDDPVDVSRTLAYDGGIPGYCKGKLKSERLGQQVAQDGHPVLIVRPFNVVGIGQVGTYGMVIPTFVHNALAGKPLQVFGDGLQSRTFSEVKTFVSILLQLIQRSEAWHKPENVVNIGTTQSTTILDLAKLVKHKVSSAVPIELVPYQRIFPGKSDVFARVPDVTRLENLVGKVDWPPLIEVLDGIIGSVKRHCRTKLHHANAFETLPVVNTETT